MKIERVLNEITRDFWTFAKAHISDKGPEPLQHFHRKLCRFLDGPSKRKLVMLPRGSFKTTMAQLYKIYRMLKDGNISILSCTESAEFAKAQSEEIKDYIMADPIYRRLRSNIWRSEEFNISTRTIVSRDMTHMSAGANTKITGKHPNLLFLDDIVGWHNSRTPGQRAKVVEWYNGALYLVGHQGEVIYTCTPYHKNDCSMEILRSPNYAKLVIPAVISKEDYEILKADDTSDSLIFKHAYPNGVPIWENRSMADIEAIREEMLSETGISTFYLQMLLTTTYERKDAFAAPLWFETDEVPTLGRDRRLVMVDPAFSLKKTACESAIIVAYIGYAGEIYVVDGQIGHFGMQDTIIKANGLARQYECEVYSEQVPLLSINSDAVSHWNNIGSGRDKMDRVEELRDHWNHAGVRIRKGDNWAPTNRTAYGGLDNLLKAAEEYPYPDFIDSLDCLAHVLRFCSC